MTSFYYFGNISVKIAPNNNKFDSFEFYTERAVEKCPRWNLEAEKLTKKSVNSIVGHPVLLLK